MQTLYSRGIILLFLCTLFWQAVQIRYPEYVTYNKNLYLMSLKSNGVLMLNDCLPHTVQTMATFTRHQVGTVERVLKIFQAFGLVEILTDGAYYMSDIQLLIGQSSSVRPIAGWTNVRLY